MLSALVLAIVVLGSTLLLMSVGVTIYRHRTGGLLGTKPVGSPLVRAELHGCWRELSEVTESLQKHLEAFHFLLGGYDADQAQRWADEGTFWRNRWASLGQRCRFGVAGPEAHHKEFEEMVAAHRELAETHAVYTKELVRFGREQTSRFDRVRDRVRDIGGRLERSGSHTEESR